MNGWFVQHVFIPLYDYITTGNMKFHSRYYWDYSFLQWRPYDNLIKKNFSDAVNMIKYAYNHVPYYKKLFDTYNVVPDEIQTEEDLLNFPVLTRQDIHNNFNDLVSDQADKLTLSHSGGSTGEPVSFYVDRETMAKHKAVMMKFYNMMGLEVGARTVRMWGAPRVINSVNTLKGKLFERLNNRLFLNGFDISEDTMGKYIKMVKKFKPELIMGYVQCVDLMAQYIRKHNIKGIRPKAVFTTTSVLYPEIRKRLEEIYGCEVYNEYGSCETGAIAHECCQHDGMHIDTEIAYIEFINKDGVHAKPGEDGELIITSLCNKAMPLIRYRIQDIGRFTDKRCKCGRGSIRITEMLGRTFGVFTALDGSKVHGYYFTNRVFMMMPNVKQFQMVQKDLNNYVVRLVRNPDFNDKDIKFIETKLKEKLGNINIKYEYYDKLHPESSGKYLYTKSYVKEGY